MKPETDQIGFPAGVQIAERVGAVVASATNLPVTSVSHIQRFCLHDGQGIRSTIFFKGCPLHCSWCQNPESIGLQPELQYDSKRCLEGCTDCVSACPRLAIGRSRAQRIDWESCDGCGICTQACPAGALAQIGREYTAEELTSAVLADVPFFEATEGGVTLSGGEPLIHPEFLGHFLPLIKSRSVHVLVQTAGGFSRQAVRPLLACMDEVWFDFKLGSAEEYKRHTGGHLQKIEDNLAFLLASGVKCLVRIPVVPGINDSDDAINRIGRRLLGLGVHKVHLLRYHRLWEAKLTSLHTKQRPLGDLAVANHKAICEQFSAMNIQAHTA